MPNPTYANGALSSHPGLSPDWPNQRTVNQTSWNKRVDAHVASDFYDMAAFRAGANSLRPTERHALGDVAGQRILHLGCHFGQDTLSLARLGAQVTGVDFSAEAIVAARDLAAELALPATFLEADILSLLDTPHDALPTGSFDGVFWSYGVMAWLPDLPRLFQTAAHFLRPGGWLYFVEFHPYFYTFSEDGTPNDHPYAEPVQYEENEGSYADGKAASQNTNQTYQDYFWAHSLGDVLTSLASSELRLLSLHEYPFIHYPLLPQAVEQSPHHWVLPEPWHRLPLQYDLHAFLPG